MAKKEHPIRKERHADDQPERQPLVENMSGGVMVQGGIQAGRDVIMGDQINQQDQRVLQINTPAEFRQALAAVQAELTALKQIPALTAEQAQMVEVVEGQVQQAAQEAQQPQPLGARISAVLTSAQATLKLLTGNVKAAVGLVLTIDKLAQVATTVFHIASAAGKAMIE